MISKKLSTYLLCLCSILGIVKIIKNLLYLKRLNGILINIFVKMLDSL